MKTPKTAHPTFTDADLSSPELHALVRKLDAAELDEINAKDQLRKLQTARPRAQERVSGRAEALRTVRDNTASARHAALLDGASNMPGPKSVHDAEVELAAAQNDALRIDEAIDRITKRGGLLEQLSQSCADARFAVLQHLHGVVYRDAIADMREIVALHSTRLRALSAVVSTPLHGYARELPIGVIRPTQPHEAGAFLASAHDHVKFYVHAELGGGAPSIGGVDAEDWLAEILGRVRDLGDVKAA